jgi:hypothetical protein
MQLVEEDAGGRNGKQPVRSMRVPMFVFAVAVALFIGILLFGHSDESVSGAGAVAGVQRNGFWGCPDPSGITVPRCTNIDWCEGNYEQVAWVAEAWNAVSSALYVFVAAFGVKAYFLKPLDRWGVGLGYLILCITGCGSIYFHGTLLRSWQLFDEVPMLFLACSLLYNTITIDPKGTFWELDQLHLRDIPTTSRTIRISMENAPVWSLFFGASTAVSVALVVAESYALFSFCFGSVIFLNAVAGVRRHSFVAELPEAQQMAERSLLCFSLGKAPYYRPLLSPYYCPLLSHPTTALSFHPTTAPSFHPTTTLSFRPFTGGLVWAGDFLACDSLGFLQLHVFWHLFSSVAAHFALQVLLIDCTINRLYY